MRFDDIEELQAGQSYALNNLEDGGMGTYIYSPTFLPRDYDTSDTHTGTVNITHFDYDNRIISSSFEFQVDVEGEVVSITHGRFDMRFGT